MRATAILLTGTLLTGALGIACAGAASAAPVLPPPGVPVTSNIEQVAGGCGWGFHRHHGYCVRNRHYRPYAYRYYRRYPYYGGYPWYRSSPSDYVANELNARELGRMYGY